MSYRRIIVFLYWLQLESVLYQGELKRWVIKLKSRTEPKNNLSEKGSELKNAWSWISVFGWNWLQEHNSHQPVFSKTGKKKKLKNKVRFQIGHQMTLENYEWCFFSRSYKDEQMALGTFHACFAVCRFLLWRQQWDSFSDRLKFKNLNVKISVLRLCAQIIGIIASSMPLVVSRC